MRLLVTSLLFGIVLAGCTQGDPGGDDGFVSTCPAWIRGLSTSRIDSNMVYSNQTTTPVFDRWDFKWDGVAPGTGLGDGLLDFQGHPLDLVSMDFRPRPGEQDKQQNLLYIQDAELHVSFFASVDGFPAEPLSAYDSAVGRGGAQEELVFRSDAVTGYRIVNITLQIELAAANAAPNPRGVFVLWQMVPNLDDNVDTASVVLTRYVAEYWYRTCDSDGTKV